MKQRSNHITLLVPYYCQPLMFMRQWEEFCKYSTEYSDRFTIILIDDGSPRSPLQPIVEDLVMPDLDIRLYRINENLPWNTPGVFNLGFTEAPEGWVFLNGIDHVLPAKAFEALMQYRLQPDFWYRPWRKQMTRSGELEEKKPPFGIILVERENFWKAGGYDEDFTGWYGNSTSLFLESLKKITRYRELHEVELIAYSPSHIADAAVKDWGRKGSTRDVCINEALMNKTLLNKQRYEPKII